MATSLLPVIGKPAPDFTLPSTTGETTSRSSSSRARRRSSCTSIPRTKRLAARAKRATSATSTAEFEKHSTVILGISTDPMDAHHKFRDKHTLPFPLLSDEDATVSKLYGVYKQKNVYGKKSMGIERTTFVIDRTGRIARSTPR